MTIIADPPHATEALTDLFWAACLEKDRRYDGLFFLAVKTTGIYCRPGCPARKPKRENAVFYAAAEDARAAGFRPCRRCDPDGARAACAERASHASLLAACRYIFEHAEFNPGANEIAEAAGVAPRQLRALFQKRLSITPKAYADAARAARFRDELQAGASVAEATYAAGFGSSSRIYENAARRFGMTPAALARGGEAQKIRYQIVKTSVGELLAAGTAKGLCRVMIGANAEELRARLEAEFCNADELRESAEHVAPWAEALAAYLDGAPWPDDLPLDIRATAFQAKVWAALKKIPAGKTATYGEIAAAIGAPKAARAVGTACAKNPVALAIPCHRVTPASGGAGQFAWGPEVKRALLAKEKRP